MSEHELPTESAGELQPQVSQEELKIQTQANSSFAIELQQRSQWDVNEIGRALKDVADILEDCKAQDEGGGAVTPDGALLSADTFATFQCVHVEGWQHWLLGRKDRAAWEKATEEGILITDQQEIEYSLYKIPHLEDKDELSPQDYAVHKVSLDDQVRERIRVMVAEKESAQREADDAAEHQNLQAITESLMKRLGIENPATLPERK